MAHQDGDQEKPAEGQAAEILAKVRAIQERARQEGFVSDGSDDKVFMDETWGEGRGDLSRQVVLRAATNVAKS